MPRLVIGCLVLAAGCATPVGDYAARLGGVEVRASFLSGDAQVPGLLQVRSTSGSHGLRAFDAVLFDDLDGDGVLGEGEPRRTVRSRSASPARSMRTATFALPRAFRRPRLRIEIATTRGLVSLDVPVARARGPAG